MTTLSPPSVNLARRGERGAALYNAYHIVAQIAALYAQSADTAAPGDAKALWGQLADQALGDLGALYEIWEWATAAQLSDPAPPAAEALWDLVARTCYRLQAILRLTNVWTPVRRLASLQLLVEGRWCRVISKLGAGAPELGQRLARLAETSEGRTRQLTTLRAAWRGGAASTDAWFTTSDTSALPDIPPLKMVK